MSAAPRRWFVLLAVAVVVGSFALGCLARGANPRCGPTDVPACYR